MGNTNDANSLIANRKWQIESTISDMQFAICHSHPCIDWHRWVISWYLNLPKKEKTTVFLPWYSPGLVTGDLVKELNYGRFRPAKAKMATASATAPNMVMMMISAMSFFLLWV